ncbi:hypothetical protein BC943DRAFT_331836 [Umbelopsis sp. AD052]|nr:hypothetical protein BC943DRAFT_331836 [Umbelopsis sp. AD052]
MATPTSSPVNAGHAYANEADDCEDREQWDKAATAHSLAAEQFQKAIVFAQDPEAVKTLRLLVMNHSRKAKTLFLKAAKANEPQPSIRGSDMSSTSSQPASSSATPNHSKIQSNNDRLSNLAIHNSNGYHDRILSTTYPASHQSHLLGSQAIDDSYALLNDQNDDDSDPFNKFWNAVETLVQKLSNPVAFASVPLNEEDNPKALMEDIYATQQGDHSKLPIQHQIEASMMESFFVVQPQTPAAPKITINGANNTTASQMPIPSKTIEEYAIENKHLKDTVDKLSRQVSYWKKAADEGNVLKSSILQFRNDVQKQAKRIMQSQESMKSSMVSGQYGAASMLSKPSKPNEGTSASATSNPQARIKELEDEVMTLRVEYNRQKDLMSKYKERWEKLKESAKKRRAQPNQNEEQISDSKSALRLEENSRTVQPPPPPRDGGRERTLLRTLAQQSSSNQHVVQSVQTSLPPFASLASSPSRLRFEHKDNSDEEV